jgi:hypothetical protein
MGDNVYEAVFCSGFLVCAHFLTESFKKWPSSK